MGYSKKHSCAGWPLLWTAAAIVAAGCSGTTDSPPSSGRAPEMAASDGAAQRDPRAMPVASPVSTALPSSDSPPAIEPPALPPVYGVSPESVWLNTIGEGAGQTAKVCMRGGADAIALALCASPTPQVRSLIDLHAALGIPETAAQQMNNGNLDDQNGAVRLIGMTANSASLVARSVSALNPRVVIGVVPDRNADAAARRGHFAIGFARGEPFAELAGYDPSAGRINFYLLAFKPQCETEHCAPAQLLTQAVEHEWQGWTLYQAEDLVNTPLDCLSCHQPGGATEPRRFLMRQLRNPWMHWMPQEPRNINCGNGNGQGRNNAADDTQVSYVTPTLFDTFRQARTGEARYAGVELATLSQVRAGRQLESFIESFEDTMGNQQVGETNEFPSRNVLADSLCENTQARWTTYRAPLQQGGRPVPFYLPDVLDAAKRDEAVVDYRAFLERQPEQDEFELLSHLMSNQALEAVGFQPEASMTAENILTEMCVRCHNDTTDPSLSRAKFNAQSLDRLSPEEARKAIERISLASDSPSLMPPRRFGTLPAWATESLHTYLGGVL
jgi:hypothetical protein